MRQIFCDAGHLDSNITDSNNCAVIALAIAAGVTYTEADVIATAAGRKPHEGFEPCNLMRGIRKHGIKSRDVRCGKQSLNQFLKKYPVGHYWVCTGTHAFAVIDGVVYDRRLNSPNIRVHGAFKMELIRSCK